MTLRVDNPGGPLSPANSPAIAGITWNRHPDLIPPPSLPPAAPHGPSPALTGAHTKHPQGTSQLEEATRWPECTLPFVVREPGVG